MASGARRALQRLVAVAAVALGILGAPAAAMAATAPSPALQLAVAHVTATKVSTAPPPVHDRAPRDAVHRALRLPVTPQAALTPTHMVLLAVPVLLLVGWLRPRATRRAPVRVRTRAPPAGRLLQR